MRRGRHAITASNVARTFASNDSPAIDRYAHLWRISHQSKKAGKIARATSSEDLRGPTASECRAHASTLPLLEEYDEHEHGADEDMEDVEKQGQHGAASAGIGSLSRPGDSTE